jgi:hypothetical protein
VADLTYRIDIQESLGIDDADDDETENYFDFPIFGKQSLQSFIRETLVTVYSKVSYKANFVKPEIVVPRSQVQNSLLLTFEGEWLWENEHGDELNDNVGRNLNSYPIPDHAPIPFGEDTEKFGEDTENVNLFELRIELHSDNTPSIAIKTESSKRDITLPDAQVLRLQGPEKIQEVVEYDSYFWKMEHMLVGSRAKPLAIEIYRESDKIKFIPFTEFQKDDSIILSIIVSDAMDRFEEFKPQTEHSYYIVMKY